MKSWQRTCGAAMIAFAALMIGAPAEAPAANSVQLAAATKVRGTPGHKTIQPVKSTPRKKSRCYG